MKKQCWPKRDPIKNYLPLPNEIFSLGLSSTAIIIYGYLLFREDRKTYECLVSYRMIGEAIGKSITTVRKYIAELEERGLITTERTSIMTKDGRKWNGCLRYHILPIQMSIGQFTEQQLRRLETGAARQKALARLSQLCGAQESSVSTDLSTKTPNVVKRRVEAVRPRAEKFTEDEEEQDKSVASYAATLVTSARSAGSLRETGVGSQTERKPQIEVTQGLYPPVSRFWDDVFGPKRRDYDG